MPDAPVTCMYVNKVLLLSNGSVIVKDKYEAQRVPFSVIFRETLLGLFSAHEM